MSEIKVFPQISTNSIKNWKKREKDTNIHLRD
jgi:hypothetical protein